MIWSAIIKLRTGSAIGGRNPADTDNDAFQINNTQFYAMVPDACRCRQSHAMKMPITIIGLSATGKVKVFSGVVQSVETGHSIHAAFPLRVTIALFYLKPCDPPRPQRISPERTSVTTPAVAPGEKRAINLSAS
jgi:hypothetical protein